MAKLIPSKETLGKMRKMFLSSLIKVGAVASDQASRVARVLSVDKSKALIEAYRTRKVRHKTIAELVRSLKASTLEKLKRRQKRISEKNTKK